MIGYPGALALATRTVAKALRPVPPIPFRDWLPKNIVLVDGPKKGEFWTAADAPYLPEIADCLSQEHPCNLVTVRKGQQRHGKGRESAPKSLYMLYNLS